MKEAKTIKYSIYGEWQKIYDEISEELSNRKFTKTELFHHCIKTCHRIFKIRHGENLSDDFWAGIAKLYEEKLEDCNSVNMPLGKYDFPTSCEQFPSGKFSISDLAKVIFKDAPIQNIDNTRNAMWQMQEKYLKKFFGLNEIRKQNNSAKSYETLRLLKILYDCKEECNVDLGCLLHMSLMKQNSDMPTTYNKASDFIKERIMVRADDSNYQLDFQRIIELEKYNYSLRNFINTFSEGIISYILNVIGVSCCRVTRRICGIIYTTMIDMLKELPVVRASIVSDAKAIQCYAYEHFLMTDINHQDYADFYAKIFQVEASENFYTQLEKFLECNRICKVKITGIKEFVNQYKKELVAIIYPDITSAKERRKYLLRIARHKESYEVLGRIYNLGAYGNISEDIEGFEAVEIMYLYEFLFDRNIDIPLYSGYTKQERRRDLKINQLVKKMQNKETENETDVPLSEEEYFLACHWLNEQMYTLTNYRTVKLQELREETKDALLEYWLATVPLITTQRNDKINPVKYLVEIFLCQVIKMMYKNDERLDDNVTDKK